MQNDLYFGSMASQGFIDTVIDNFLAQMVRPDCISIHPRPTTYRFQTIKNLNGAGIILFSHNTESVLKTVYVKTMYLKKSVLKN
jgi:hypothetical protein